MAGQTVTGFLYTTLAISPLRRAVDAVEKTLAILYTNIHHLDPGDTPQRNSACQALLGVKSYVKMEILPSGNRALASECSSKAV